MEDVFQTLLTIDVVSGNAMMIELIEHGCFQMLEIDGIVFDSITIICALLACRSKSVIGKGKELLHSWIISIIILLNAIA